VNSATAAQGPFKFDQFGTVVQNPSHEPIRSVVRSARQIDTLRRDPSLLPSDSPECPAVNAGGQSISA
jgi:hypothetical protein